MDIVLLLLGFLCMLLGIVGSILPVLPGPSISWVGLLILYLTKALPNDWLFLGSTLVIALAVTVVDYIIPAMGTKRFGGSKYGMYGAILGLLMGFFFPIFGLFGIVIWPFIGALVGELVNKSDQKTALKAAFGSFIGFITGTFLKFMVALIFLGLFIMKVWEYKGSLFSF